MRSFTSLRMKISQALMQGFTPLPYLEHLDVEYQAGSCVAVKSEVA